MTLLEWVFYALPMVLIWGLYWWFHKRKHHKAQRQLRETQESGMTEPASLHPVIDPNKCLGCGACTRACPEGDILGLIHGKAELVEPANCIGHGACKASCPFDAITLVFGTATRGIDLPVLTPEFETTAPNVFIAGELGGMGLIRNAISQGVQAVEAIAARVANPHSADWDLVIVGAGPAGIGAALEAKKRGLNYKVIEQDSLGGTVAHFPRRKLVMTAPVELPLYGKANFKETSKEELLEFWQDVMTKTRLKISFGERLEASTATAEGFELVTTKGRFTTRCLLLCLGRRGTPRKLGVAGEEQSKVVYSLTDPAQYRGQRVLVVGGGDSALEAATSLAEEPGTQVTLSYRSAAFGRAKVKNRKKLEALQASGAIQVLMESEVLAIEPDLIRLKHRDQMLNLANDAVIVCAGGVLPTPFLQKIGIHITTKFGEV